MDVDEYLKSLTRAKPLQMFAGGKECMSKTERSPAPVGYTMQWRRKEQGGKLESCHIKTYH